MPTGRLVRTRADVARQLGEAILAAVELVLAEAAPAAEPAPSTSDLPRLLKLDEVATILGLSRTSVKALLDVRLRAVHHGRAVRVPSEDVEAYRLERIAASSGRLPGESEPPLDPRRSRRRSPRRTTHAVSSAAQRGAPRRPRNQQVR